MSKEWLAQLSAQAAQRGKARYLMPVPRPQPAAARAAANDGPAADRSFIGAIIGSIIRWAIFAAIAGAIAVFIISDQQELQDSPGESVLYSVWYLAAVTLPAMFPESAAGIDANGVYNALKPHTGLLPFLLPLAFGIAVTILFLPTVNARRRGSGLRIFIFIGNLVLVWFGFHSNTAAIHLTDSGGWIEIDSLNMMPVFAWLVLLVISFVGGPRRFRAPPPQATARPLPAASSPAARPPSQAPGAARAAVQARTMPPRRSGSPIERTVSGSTWRRPR